MLEVVMLGVVYILLDNVMVSRMVDYGLSVLVLVSVLNVWLITTETDRAYEESLRADREKEA